MKLNPLSSEPSANSVKAYLDIIINHVIVAPIDINSPEHEGKTPEDLVHHLYEECVWYPLIDEEKSPASREPHIRWCVYTRIAEQYPPLAHVCAPLIASALDQVQGN